MSRDIIALICVSVCFSKAFLKRRYAKLACSFVYLWLKGNISSPVRYSYLSIFPDDNADMFAASLLIPCCNSSKKFFFKRFFLKRKGLSCLKVASVT